MSRFCSKCGAKVVEDSLFCEYCGNKLKSSTFVKRSVPPPTQESIRKPAFRSYNQVPQSSSSPSYYRRSRRSSSQGIKWLFIGIFFIVIIGFAAVVLLGIIVLPISINQIIDHQYDYIGEKTFSIDSLTNSSDSLTNTSSYVDLDIYNSLGSVDIEFTNISKLLEARILVYTREGRNLHDANTFEESHYDDHHYVFFDSSTGPYSENPYLYELEIAISNHATTALNVEVSTGSISVIAYETNISSLLLDTSTGSITTNFQEVFFNASNNLYIHTSTGSITSTFNNVNYSSSEVDWILDTSTGSIDLNLLQKSIIENTLVTYDVETSTGSISFYHQLNSTIGLRMYAAVPTGTIYTPSYSTDDEYSYKSENYDSATMKLYLSMHTSTGSITIL